MSDQTDPSNPETDQEAATAPQTPQEPGQAAPGPHPHEASDIGYQAGQAAKMDDPMEGFRDEDGDQEQTEPES